MVESRCQEKYPQSQTFRWYHSDDRKWRKIKKPLDEGERGKCKSWLIHNDKKKLRSWPLIPSLPVKWRRNGSSVRCYILGLKDHCMAITMKLKNNWSLERKLCQIWTAYCSEYETSTTLIDYETSISRDINHLANKNPYSQSYFNSNVWLWKLDWLIRKTEQDRTDAFKLWCWKRLLRVSWAVKRSN